MTAAVAGHRTGRRWVAWFQMVVGVAIAGSNRVETDEPWPRPGG